MIVLSSKDRSADVNEFEVLLDEDIKYMLLNEKLIKCIREILAT